MSRARVRLLAAVLLATATASIVAACGGEDEEAAVRETLDAFVQGTEQKDYQRLCDDVFATKLVQEVAKVLPCEAALSRSDLGEAKDPKIEVRSVEVDGATATARVRSSAANQKPSEDTVRLVKEDDGWRIVALAS